MIGLVLDSVKVFERLFHPGIILNKTKKCETIGKIQSRFIECKRNERFPSLFFRELTRRPMINVDQSRTITISRQYPSRECTGFCVHGYILPSDQRVARDAGSDYTPFLLSLRELEFPNDATHREWQKIGEAQFRFIKHLEPFDVEAATVLDPRLLRELVSGAYLSDHRNIILLGNHRGGPIFRYREGSIFG